MRRLFSKWKSTKKSFPRDKQLVVFVVGGGRIIEIGEYMLDSNTFWGNVYCKSYPVEAVTFWEPLDPPIYMG